jgi:hypothetical protein
MVFVLVAIALFAHGFGLKWYTSSADHSIVLGFVMLTCMAMLVRGNIIAPR